MFTSLSAIQDDFNLNANADTPRGDAVSMTFGPYFLVDEAGNFLVDEAGNFLIAYDTVDNLSSQKLRANPDDFQLNAE